MHCMCYIYCYFFCKFDLCCIESSSVARLSYLYLVIFYNYVVFFFLCPRIGLDKLIYHGIKYCNLPLKEKMNKLHVTNELRDFLKVECLKPVQSKRAERQVRCSERRYIKPIIAMLEGGIGWQSRIVSYLRHPFIPTCHRSPPPVPQETLEHASSLRYILHRLSRV